ncbi:hypothetical protein ACOME3_003185 [Neoechinorhynchus agilis]
MGGKSTKSKEDASVLTNDDVQLLLNNTLYDENRIRQWHKAFLTDCPNGRLDKKKLLEAYKLCYGSTTGDAAAKPEKFVSHVFHTFDTDNSGYIDFVEFLVALSITSNGRLEDKLKMAFDIYDVNKNGYVEKKEMVKILTAIYDLMGKEDRTGANDPKKRVDFIMQHLDKDHDNRINRDEFIRGCVMDEVVRAMLTPMFTATPETEQVPESVAEGSAATTSS